MVYVCTHTRFVNGLLPCTHSFINGLLLPLHSYINLLLVYNHFVLNSILPYTSLSLKGVPHYNQWLKTHLLLYTNSLLNSLLFTYAHFNVMSLHMHCHQTNSDTLLRALLRVKIALLSFVRTYTSMKTKMLF